MLVSGIRELLFKGHDKRYVITLYEFHTFYFFHWSWLSLEKGVVFDTRVVVFIRKDEEELYMVRYQEEEDIILNREILVSLSNNSKEIEIAIIPDELQKILRRMEYNKDIYTILKESDKDLLSL